MFPQLSLVCIALVAAFHPGTVGAHDVAIAQQQAKVTPFIELPWHVNGTKIDLIWKSPFQYSDLEVWQGPTTDGAWAWKLLASNLTCADTTYEWIPNAVDPRVVENMPFHFLLQESSKLDEQRELSNEKEAFLGDFNLNRDPKSLKQAPLQPRDELTLTSWEPLKHDATVPSSHDEMIAAVSIALGILGVLLLGFVVVFAVMRFSSKRAREGSNIVEKEGRNSFQSCRE